MALIHCPECDKEISDQVRSCPHCGYPMKKREPWKIVVPIAAAAAVCVGGAAIYNHAVVEPRTTYNRAISLYDQGKYEEAARYFGEIPRYRDVADYMADIDTNQKYQQAVDLAGEGLYQEADALFSELTGFKDTDAWRARIAQELAYQEAEDLFAQGSYDEARQKLEDVTDAQRAQELTAKIQAVEAACDEAQRLLDDGQFDAALTALDGISDNPRVDSLKEDILTVQTAYTQAEMYYSKGQYDQAREMLSPLADFAQPANLLGQMDADEEGNAYIDSVKRYAFDVQTGAEAAQRLLDWQNEIWCSAAWQEYDWITDRFTTQEDGRFVSPEEALERFALSEECTAAQEMLEENRRSVIEQYTALDSVPNGMEEVYEQVQLLHNTYRELTELAASGSADSFENISARIGQVQGLEAKYTELSQQLLMELPEKIAIVSAQEEAYDFRHIRFGMTADEVKEAEALAYGMEPAWEIASLIGYSGLATADGQAYDLIYALDEARYVQAAYILTNDALGEDVSAFLNLPVSGTSITSAAGRNLTVEADRAAGILTIFPEDAASHIVLPTAGGPEEANEAAMEEETETEVLLEGAGGGLSDAGGMTVLLPASADAETEALPGETEVETASEAESGTTAEVVMEAGSGTADEAETEAETEFVLEALAGESEAASEASEAILEAPEAASEAPEAVSEVPEAISEALLPEMASAAGMEEAQAGEALTQQNTDQTELMEMTEEDGGSASLVIAGAEETELSSEMELSTETEISSGMESSPEMEISPETEILFETENVSETEITTGAELYFAGQEKAEGSDEIEAVTEIPTEAEAVTENLGEAEAATEVPTETGGSIASLVIAGADDAVLSPELETDAAEAIDAGEEETIVDSEEGTMVEGEDETMVGDETEISSDDAAAQTESIAEDQTEEDAVEEEPRTASALLDQIGGLLKLARLQAGLAQGAEEETDAYGLLPDAQPEAPEAGSEEAETEDGSEAPQEAELADTVDQIRQLLQEAGEALAVEESTMEAQEAEVLQDRLQEYQAELEDLLDTIAVEEDEVFGERTL